MTPATELVIDIGAILENWRFLAVAYGRGAQMGVAAVVKADAYGLGAAQVAPALYAAGCRHFFVAHLEEAVGIRPLVPGAMVAVLNGLWPGAAADHVGHELHPVLGSLAEIAEWSAEARRQQRVLPALLHVDTGMNRLGLCPPELATLGAEAVLLDGVRIDFVMTHLVSAERPGDAINEAQRIRFAGACADLPPARRSIANSSGLFLGPAYASDLARPGAALYGVNPTPGGPNPMRPVVRLRARILQVREVPPGATVGYNGIWTASRPSRIATVSVGYADGYPRRLGNHAVACFDGRPVPLVGRVSMDLSTFDVTDAPAAVPGGWLELIGPGNPIDAVAEQAGTNGYEILTSLGRRYARTYLPA